MVCRHHSLWLFLFDYAVACSVSGSGEGEDNGRSTSNNPGVGHKNPLCNSTNTPPDYSMKPKFRRAIVNNTPIDQSIAQKKEMEVVQSFLSASGETGAMAMDNVKNVFDGIEACVKFANILGPLFSSVGTVTGMFSSYISSQIEELRFQETLHQFQLVHDKLKVLKSSVDNLGNQLSQESAEIQLNKDLNDLTYAFGLASNGHCNQLKKYCEKIYCEKALINIAKNAPKLIGAHYGTSCGGIKKMLRVSNSMTDIMGRGMILVQGLKKSKLLDTTLIQKFDDYKNVVTHYLPLCIKNAMLNVNNFVNIHVPEILQDFSRTNVEVIFQKLKEQFPLHHVGLIMWREGSEVYHPWCPPRSGSESVTITHGCVILRSVNASAYSPEYVARQAAIWKAMQDDECCDGFNLKSKDICEDCLDHLKIFVPAAKMVLYKHKLELKFDSVFNFKTFQWDVPEAEGLVYKAYRAEFIIVF